MGLIHPGSGSPGRCSQFLNRSNFLADRTAIAHPPPYDALAWDSRSNLRPGLTADREDRGAGGQPPAPRPATLPQPVLRLWPPGSVRRQLAAAAGTRAGSSAMSSTSSIDMTGWNVICLADVRRHVVEVTTVALGQDHFGQARRMRGEHLLLEPADRQHPALQRDLAGHADGALRTGRPVSSDASAVTIVTPALGPSFGIAPAGTWTWNSRFSNAFSGRCPSASAWPLHVGQRDPRRLLHDVAQLAGQDQPARRPVMARRLDEQDVAARAGHRQAGGDARDRRACRRLLEDLRRPSASTDGVDVDRDRLVRRTRRDLRRRLAQQGAELALQLADAGLARVLVARSGAEPRRPR